MPKATNPLNDEQNDAPPPTIDERVELGRQTGHHYDGAIVPFPKEMQGSAIAYRAPGSHRPIFDRLFAGGYKDTVYEYRNAQGEILQAVIRFDHPTEGKTIRPLRYMGNFEGKGHQYWATAIEKPRPLYGLDRLATRPDAPVLIVEGEKAAEAAALKFPDHVSITWMSGAANVKNTEMLALADRSLVLWPDNDPPGRAAMRMFAAMAYQAGAASVRIVDVPRDYPAKWDLADAVPSGIADELLPASLLQAARLVTAAEVAHLTADARSEAEQRRLLGHEPGHSRVDMRHVETALNLLDPDMYRAEWSQVARCLFLAFGDKALAMFDRWSAGSDDKYQNGEPAKLWKGYETETHFRAKSLFWLFGKAASILNERNEAGEGPNVELDRDAIARAAIEELNENHAVVTRGGKTGVLWENYDPRFGRYTETYLSKRDFVDRFVRPIEIPADDDDELDPKKKKKAKRLAQGAIWFSSPVRRQFDGVHFAPGRHMEPTFLNTWRGFTVKPTDNPEGWALFKNHLLLHVAGGDRECYEYILNWMAFAVQKLDQPIRTALVLIGPKGAGKSIIVEILGELFGQHKFVTSRMEDAIGRFNDRMETTILLGLEEAIAPQNRAADGTLKDLITRNTLRLEGKFFGIWEAPNHLRIIVTSNNDHVVRADGSERRYAVFEVDNPHQADPQARVRYFGEMIAQMETGGYGAMLGELLNRDISRFNPEVIPETNALRKQKLFNLANDPVRSYLYERLTDGIDITLGNAAPSAAHHLWSRTATVDVPFRDLKEDFQRFCEAHGMPYSERKLAEQLKLYMPEGFESEVRRAKFGDDISGSVRVYPFPSLEMARSSFEKKTGLRIERS